MAVMTVLALTDGGVSCNAVTIPERARGAEWNQHATADDRSGLTHAIGESHLQRNGEGNVAEFRHELLEFNKKELWQWI